MERLLLRRTGLAGRPVNTDATAIESLVQCDCGHAIGMHDSLGCRGMRPRHCACDLDRGHVLDLAVDQSVADHRAGLR